MRINGSNIFWKGWLRDSNCFFWNMVEWDGVNLYRLTE